MSDFRTVTPAVESLKNGGNVSWNEFTQEGNTLNISDVALVDGRFSASGLMAAVKKMDGAKINVDLKGQGGSSVRLELRRNDNYNLVAAIYKIEKNKFEYFAWSAVEGKPVPQKKSIYSGVELDLNEFSARLTVGNQWPDDPTAGTNLMLDINSNGVVVARGSNLQQPRPFDSNFGNGYDRKVDFRFHTTY